MSGSLCWLSFNSYYFSAWPIHHLECFLIYCRDNVDSSDMEDIHCGLEMKTPGCRFPDRNIIFLSSEVSSLPLCFDLWRRLDGRMPAKLGADRTSSPLLPKCCRSFLYYQNPFLFYLFFIHSANVNTISEWRCWSSHMGKCFDFCPFTFSLWPHPCLWKCKFSETSAGSEPLCGELLLVAGIQMELLVGRLLWKVCQHFWAGKTRKVKFCLFPNAEVLSCAC